MRRALPVAAVLLLLIAALIYVQYRSDLSSAHRELLAGSRVADTACGPIEYAATGSGPAVLLIHGAGGGYSQMQSIGESLAASGFQAIAMSRFGYLRTPLPPDASPAAQADAHACLLDALGIASAMALGASAGAPSAIEYCLRHAARCPALALLVPAITVPGRSVGETTPPSAFWQLVFDYALSSDFVIWALTRGAPSILVETLLATPLEQFRNASPAERERALGMIRDIFPVSPKAAGLRNDARIVASSIVHRLERLSAPTLAISAQDDLYGTYAGAAYAAQRIPIARLVGYPDGGHAWLGHDVDVRRELVAFLRSSAPSLERRR